MKTVKQAALWLSLMGLFCPFSNNAQNWTGRLYGTVTDKQSGIPLPGVNLAVTFQDKMGGTTTNESGAYLLNLPVGRFSVTASMMGYETWEARNVLLTSGKDLFLDIELTEKVENLDEVVIKARLKSEVINEFAMSSARTFTVEETNKYAGSWGDPARMVSNYAGVITAGDQRNDIIIRGNSPTGLLWKLDGIIIPNPNHFGTFGTTGGPICILNNYQLSNSDFYTGAFPAEYGNALSGVFDLKMRNGNNHKHEFTGGMGFNGFELGAEGPINKSKGSSYMVNYRYTMMDLMYAMGMFDVGGVPKYTDLSFKFFIPTKKAGSFSLIGLGGISHIDLEEDMGSGWTADMLPGTQVSYGSKMGVVGLIHKYFFSENSRLESSVSASFSNSNNKVDSIDAVNTENFYNNTYTEATYSLSTDYYLKKSASTTFQAGLLAQLFDFRFFDEFYNTHLNDYQHETDANGQTALCQGYAQLRKRITGNFSVQLGLHGQWFALNDQYSLEPRAGLSYAPGKKHRFSLGYGLHGQMQPMLVYFTQTPANGQNDDYERTNKNLGFTKSHHFSTGYDLSITPNLRMKIEAYYQHLYNIPVENKSSYYSLANYGANFYNETMDSLVNKGTGRNMGIEFTLEKYLNNHFYYLVSASLYDSKYRGSDQVLRNTAFNGNYTLNVLAGYELPIKNDLLSVNVKTVWAGGKRYIPIDIEKSALQGHTVYDYDHAYDEKFSDYFRIDLRISFRQNLKKISQEWSFDVQNLTGHRNILAQRYNNSTQSIVDILQMGFFPIGSWKIYF